MPHIQNTYATSSQGTASPSLPNVGVGNAIIAALVQTSTTPRTYTVSTPSGAPITTLLTSGSTRLNNFYIIRNAPGGTITFTATADNANTPSFRLALWEWSGLDPTATPITGFFDDGVGVNTHYCSADPGLTTTTDVAVAVFLAGSIDSVTGVTSVEPSGGYIETALSTSTSNIITAFAAYQEFPGPINNDRGIWTSTGTVRRGISAMVALPLLSGGAPVSSWGTQGGTLICC